jgi:selenocysteine lyase/cysteine desulfurase
LLGLVALAAAAKMLRSIGFDNIQAHERRLVDRGLKVFGSIPEVILHGQSMFEKDDDRLPIFPFTVRGIPFAKIAAILGREHNIAVRQGHLCQYEFMRRELGISPKEQRHIEEDLKNDDKSSRFGMIRASCGACSSEDDLIVLGVALQTIIRGKVSLDYRLGRTTGEYEPVDAERLNMQWIPPALRFLFR